MGKGKKYNSISPEAVFKRLYGVKPDSFEKMTAILRKEYLSIHKAGGSTPKLSIEDKLTVTLKYLREYRTMESIGVDYEVSKSTVCESIQWQEIINILNNKIKARCPMCSYNNFALADSCIRNDLQEDLNSINLGGPSIPSAALLFIQIVVLLVIMRLVYSVYCQNPSKKTR